MPDSAQLFDTASAEFKFVAACCRWRGSPSRLPVLRELSQQPLQWSRVFSLANRHRVSGLVADATASLTSVPQEVACALAAAKQDILLANMAALRALVQLAKLLNAKGVPFVVMKGLPLAMQAYGNLALRQSRDIDLLIRECDVVQVDDLLRSLGFGRVGLDADLTEAQQELWIRSRKHFEYLRVADKVLLEVHWRTTDNRYLLDTPDPAIEREEMTLSPGTQIPVLPNDKLLLNLAVHGAGHAWFRLKWVADMAAMLGQQNAADRAQFYAVAQQHGLERVAWQVLHLCRALFPEDFPELMDGPSVPAQMLTRIAATALLEEDLVAPTASADYVPRYLALSHLLLRTGWRYRVEEIRLNLIAPSDWQVLRLPRGFQWLYPLLRVPFWAKRRFLSRKQNSSH